MSRRVAFPVSEHALFVNSGTLCARRRAKGNSIVLCRTYLAHLRTVLIAEFRLYSFQPSSAAFLREVAARHVPHGSFIFLGTPGLR